jgi:hypothetical protein
MVVINTFCIFFNTNIREKILLKEKILKINPLKINIKFYKKWVN